MQSAFHCEIRISIVQRQSMLTSKICFSCSSFRFWFCPDCRFWLIQFGYDITWLSYVSYIVESCLWWQKCFIVDIGNVIVLNAEIDHSIRNALDRNCRISVRIFELASHGVCILLCIVSNSALNMYEYFGLWVSRLAIFGGDFLPISTMALSLLLFCVRY